MICCQEWYSPSLFTSNNKGVLFQCSPIIHICSKISEHKGFHRCDCGEITLVQERTDSAAKDV